MIDHMPDQDKLKMIRALIESMSGEFKLQLTNELFSQPQQGEEEITVTSDERFVRVAFTRPLTWFLLPKVHAVQLAALLMQHAGVQFEKRRDDGSAGPAAGSPSTESV